MKPLHTRWSSRPPGKEGGTERRVQSSVSCTQDGTTVYVKGTIQREKDKPAHCGAWPSHERMRFECRIR
eukprot:517091-Prymnesium_polylepis.2